MTIIYHLTTRAYLHGSKKFFDCRCKMVAYLDHIISLSKEKLGKKELRRSISVVRIDDELMPKYKRLFTESPITIPSGDPESDEEIAV